MAENLNPTIEKNAVNAVEKIFLKCDSKIAPHFSRDDKFPLLDGYIIIYKTPDRNNDNIFGMIDVQIKGKTHKNISFDETTTFSMEKNFLQLIHDKLGGLFFVVNMDSSTFESVQVYYGLFDFKMTTELFENIKDHATITTKLKKYFSLSDFTKECEQFISIRKILVGELEKKDPMPLDRQVPKNDVVENTPTWYKTIYINTNKYFDKHPLLLVYPELKINYRSFILVGEPRLGKSYEMKALYRKLKDENNYLARFLDLSQYCENNLEKDLGMDDTNLSYEIILDGYDEISPYHVKNFNTEIERLSIKYRSAMFVISSRENYKDKIPVLDHRIGHNFEVYLTVSDFNDLQKIEEDDINKLQSIDSGILRELFLIPIYRPIIAKIDSKSSIYDTLIYHALKQNREKIVRTYGPNALQSDEMIICTFKKIAFKLYNSESPFFYKEENSLLFETDFVKSMDGINYTFSNKTYYDYFIATNYLNSTFEDIEKFFFVNDKLKVTTIDIFVIFSILYIIITIIFIIRYLKN
jgi:hypothetical protein